MDGEYLFDFSELLYGFRNDIVHNNQSLELLIQRKKDRGIFLIRQLNLT